MWGFLFVWWLVDLKMDKATKVTIVGLVVGIIIGIIGTLILRELKGTL